MESSAADSTSKPCRLAVVGAGPIGVELALGAARQGLAVQVFERCGGPAGTVESYSHVQLFSPWSINTTELGRKVLEDAGSPIQDLEQCPDGREFVDSYLAPLTACINKHPDCKVHFGTEVVSIGRGFLLKGESINGGQLKFPIGRPLVTKERSGTPFRLLVRDGDGEERYEEEFDLVADCSGAYFRKDVANWAGPGGLPALGERVMRARGRTWSIIPDVLGEHRERFAGRRTAVVGGGYSAITTVRLLLQLAGEESGTEVLWATRCAGDPFEVLEEDVLPLRKTLCIFGNKIAAGEETGVEYICGCNLRAVAAKGERLNLAFDVAGGEASGSREEEVDELVTCVGYHPDASLYEELQVHQCYASDGPIKLAASLLGASGDCMKQAAPGVDMLKNPEPGFFILGSKSYGRNSAFLLKIGFEQVKVVLESILAETGVIKEGES